MEDKGKKKFAMLNVAYVLLVAMVVGLIDTTESLQHRDKDDTFNAGDIKTSTKGFCGNTDYKETCIESLLSGVVSSEPKILIKTAFDSTIKHLEEAFKSTTTMEGAYSDPRTHEAIKACQELTDLAIRDLRKCFETMDVLNIDWISEALSEMKILLSSAITNEETCLDGFEKTEGDAGDKMREALKESMEMTSNALSIITDVSQTLLSMDPRKIFSHDLLPTNFSSFGLGDIPFWLDNKSQDLIDQSPEKIKPNLTVAKDGSGNFKTIGEALKAIPTNGKERFVLYIKEGIYQENIKIFSNLTKLMIVGDGPTKTRITGRLNFIDGTPTYHTATFAISGEDFIARDIGFENSAGPEKHQAVALRVSGDRAIFYNCHMDGYQDTLYVHTYRQFYRDCMISGTIDFIFGDSAAVFQTCTFVVRKPMDNQQCIVTAQGRKDVKQPTGLVLQNCSFIADPQYYPLRKKNKSFLARPWKEYSRTIIMESYIDDLIDPQGWLPWNETFALDTLFYTEFNNRGPGSSKAQRAKWIGVKELPANRIKRFTANKFIMGNLWVPQTGTPYTSGFMFPQPNEDSSHAYSTPSPEENRDETPILNRVKQSNSHEPTLDSGHENPSTKKPKESIIGANILGKIVGGA